MGVRKTWTPTSQLFTEWTLQVQLSWTIHCFDQQKVGKILHLDGEEFLPYQMSFFVKGSILNSHATPMAGSIDDFTPLMTSG